MLKHRKAVNQLSELQEYRITDELDYRITGKQNHRKNRTHEYF